MCPHIFVTMCICRPIAFSMAVGFDFPTSRLGNLCSTFILTQVMGHMVATSDYTWEHAHEDDSQNYILCKSSPPGY